MCVYGTVRGMENSGERFENIIVNLLSTEELNECCICIYYIKMYTLIFVTV